MIKSESYRIHLDWWGQCRTCKHWKGDRDTMEEGPCNNELSPMHNRPLWISDECAHWDTFDEETACEVLEHEKIYERES